MNTGAALRLCTLAAGAWCAFAQSESRTLATLPAESTSTYRLTVAPCVNHACPLIIHWTRDGRDLDSVPLQLSASSADFAKATSSPADGAGDPLFPDTTVTVWTSGDEEASMTVTARTFRLTATLNGILVDQRTGFEHVKRRHTLLAVIDRKLAVIWNATEGSGNTYSTTAPVTDAQGGEFLIYYSSFSYPEETAPDKVRIQSLCYSQASHRLVDCERPLTGWSAGPFPTVAAAWNRRRELRACDIPLWVLPAAAIPGGKNGFFLATGGSTPAINQRAGEVLGRCAGPETFKTFRSPQGSLVSW